MVGMTCTSSVGPTVPSDLRPIAMVQTLQRRRNDQGDRRQGLFLLQIPSRSQQNVRVFTEQTDPAIAVVAKQPADLACYVVMVNRQVAEGCTNLPADSTYPALLHNKSIELIQCQAVQPFDVPAAVVVRIRQKARYALGGILTLPRAICRLGLQVGRYVRLTTMRTDERFMHKIGLNAVVEI